MVHKGTICLGACFHNSFSLSCRLLYQFCTDFHTSLKTAFFLQDDDAWEKYQAEFMVDLEGVRLPEMIATGEKTDAAITAGRSTLVKQQKMWNLVKGMSGMAEQKQRLQAFMTSTETKLSGLETEKAKGENEQRSARQLLGKE